MSGPKENKKNNSSQIFEYWDLLQRRLDQLSAPQMKDMLNTFFTKLINSAKIEKGALDMFKIIVIYIEACEMFGENNINTIVVPEVDKTITSQDGAVAEIEEPTNPPHFKRSSGASSLILEPLIYLLKAEQCENENQASSPQKQFQEQTKKEVESGGKTTPSELNPNMNRSTDREQSQLCQKTEKKDEAVAKEENDQPSSSQHQPCAVTEKVVATVKQTKQSEVNSKLDTLAPYPQKKLCEKPEKEVESGGKTIPSQLSPNLNTSTDQSSTSAKKRSLMRDINKEPKEMVSNVPNDGTNPISNKAECFKLKREVTRVKKKCITQLHNKNKKHQKEKEKLRAENRKLMEKYHEQNGWKERFHLQTRTQLKQLQEWEGKFDRATKIISDISGECFKLKREVTRVKKKCITQLHKKNKKHQKEKEKLQAENRKLMEKYHKQNDWKERFHLQTRTQLKQLQEWEGKFDRATKIISDISENQEIEDLPAGDIKEIIAHILIEIQLALTGHRVSEDIKELS